MIGAYAQMVRGHIDNGWSGHMMTFMFNQIGGGFRQMNLEMQTHIGNVYASLVTRLHRRPHAPGVTLPILLSCPDFPVAKHQKKPLSEVITNGGLHNHGLLLIPPGPNRLKVSVSQHFVDQQSHYLRDQILNRIDVSRITHDVGRVTDYVMKGLKAHRLPDDETLLILPNSRGEVSVRPYTSSSEEH
jgi:hypothetical protein